ncbi:MAG: aminopeptidase P family protein [Spirochaetes bacterium]|nr:aminopeptidase P family protein [Spirochaetota bacterium]
MCNADIKRRVNKIFDAVSAGSASGTEIERIKPPDAIFVFNRNGLDSNYLYLTGLSGGVFNNCGLIAEKGGHLTLFSSSLEEELSRTATGYDEIIVYSDEEEREAVLKKALSAYKKVGIAYERIPHSFYRRMEALAGGIELCDVSNAFRLARIVKSEYEIERITRACAIADNVARQIPPMLSTAVTENDLRTEIDYRIKKEGAKGPAFDTIVAFGENTSKPHYTGGEVPLRPGAHVLVDFGAEYAGYRSDITRVYFTGSPHAGLIDLYRTVNEAKELALSLIADGINAHDVEERVKTYIDSHESYNGRFIHSLGHSLGIDVHDDSYPIKSRDGMFCENMVLTVEPGIYLPGLYGVRLEDDIIVRKKGCDLLTSPVREPETYEI